jgi:hypothetical protein
MANTALQAEVAVEAISSFGVLPDNNMESEDLAARDELAEYYGDIVGTGLVHIRIGE